MKLENLNPYSFRNLLPKIQAQTAGCAGRHLILYPNGSMAGMVQRHLSVSSAFCRSAVAMGYLTQEQMNRAALRYRLGMSRDGGVIFWQMDRSGHVCDGKIMYYRADCHRDHDRHPTWVVSELKSFYLRDEPELAAAIQPPHCLFGMHLSGPSWQPVAIVEAEKTAVIMSEIYPDSLWLAAGGMSELTPARLLPLRGCRITLFPDTDEDGRAYSLWYKVCQESQHLLGHPVFISPLLELSASSSQKRRKIDILDYCFETIRK